jgi:hypothetical protein
LPPTCSIGVAANALALTLALKLVSCSSSKFFSSIVEQLESMINRKARKSHILFVFIMIYLKVWSYFLAVNILLSRSAQEYWADK